MRRSTCFLDIMFLRRVVIVRLFLLLVFVNALLVFLSLFNRQAKRIGPTVVRFDCLPEHSHFTRQSAGECRRRGCVWDPNGDEVKCYYPHDYINYNIMSSHVTDKSIKIRLGKNARPSGFRHDVSAVIVTLEGVNDDVVDLRIEEDCGNDGSRRWQSPLPRLNLSRYVADPKWILRSRDGHISVHRRANDEEVFHTNVQQLIFSEQFLQLISHVPSRAFYGFGQRMGRHRKTLEPGKSSRKFPFWNHRLPDKEPSHGSHPFYLMYEKGSNLAHGVLFLNSNAAEATLTDSPCITYRTIGGDLRFLIFLGPDPVHVIRQKAGVIGHSPLPPYWSLGFHLSRAGYGGLANTRRVLQANVAAGIPIDTQYLDIEHTMARNTLSIDQQKYGNVKEFAAWLHSTNRRLIPVLDMEISSHAPEWTQTHDAFIRGQELDIFMKNADGSLMLTKHRNPEVALPDFTHPNVSLWWTEQLQRLHQQMPFDGLWLDVNEPDVKWTSHARSKCKARNKYNRPQYNPVHPHQLMTRTICLSARHWIAPNYDVHNIHPLFQAMHTHSALRVIHPERRPFILSRATTTGSGSHVAHWTGDMHSSWHHMRTSIAALLDFNLFGLPMTGTDICGFQGNTNRELCARWHALGAFYPFARNHNDKESIAQDPVSLGSLVTRAARNALRLRYQLLPFLYTLFHQNSVYGDPVVRSLKMNFPRDENTDDIDDQLMWGSSLLMTPVLDHGVRTVTAYFPAGIWYDFRSGIKVSDSGIGVFKELNIPLTEISVTVRGGSVIPIKLDADVMTTADHQVTAFALIVALDEAGHASGSLYWDEGDGVRTQETRRYFETEFRVQDRLLQSRVVHWFNYSGNMKVHEVVVFGFSDAAERVTVQQEGQPAFELKSKLATTGQLKIPVNSLIGLDRDFQIRW